MSAKTEISTKKYGHYNDYAFKSILQKRANGLLEFAGIPYKIKRTIITELTDIQPNIHRIDFAGEVYFNGEEICMIVECQSELPTEDDIRRFFQYISSFRVFKNCKVELYILCIKKAPYTKKDFVIKDGCTYTMHIISFKDFQASEIFNRIENKLKYNKEITDEDIASLQVIVYTSYSESKLEIITKARKLIDKIAEKSEMDINEKTAIVYLLDVLSANMLDETELDNYMEETKMKINPVERYYTKLGKEEGIKEGRQKGIKEGRQEGIKEGRQEGIKEGRQEGIKEGRQEGIKEGRQEYKLEIVEKMLKDNYSIEKISELTGLSKKEILKGN
ncbi:MAG: hypothetical protein IJL02_05950 [Methanobrevibacter sp.]|uniref:hypothetical protein n=1 Tax=Methanobrevibacter sp. TaxID=66852 RepID=UPI0025DE9C3F|nr:hypothetical protein [Methanobrevibacter sp.]MBQ6099390.1 hypothetical protein [Methanobrevibacter sp.]